MRLCTVLLGMLLVGFFATQAWGSNFPGPEKEEGAKAEKEAKEKKEEKSTLEKLGIHFYGHFKLDMAYDTAETQFGDTAFFVKNYNTGEKDEEFNMHARHTRFGMHWYGPEYNGIKAYGNLELDFLGKGTQKNTETEELQAEVRMRHAYMKFDFQGKNFSILAGQTWDVFGPLNMNKLNTLVGWGQGNIGFRRPQLRATKWWNTGEDGRTTLALAIARPVARDKLLDDDLQDDGEDSGYPDAQGHLGYKLFLYGDKAMQVGIGGFYGKRELGGPSAALVSDEHYNSYVGALDFKFPLLENLDLFGEYWQGRGLDGYRGAVWQSYVVDNSSVRTIHARGAFLNLVWWPHKEWRIVGGAGVDDPKDKDFHGSSGRYKNSTIFGNVLYKFYKGAWVGLEYDRMETDWHNNKDRINHRIQMSWMLKF